MEIAKLHRVCVNNVTQNPQVGSDDDRYDTLDEQQDERARSLSPERERESFPRKLKLNRISRKLPAEKMALVKVGDSRPDENGGGGGGETR